jgi:PAS domain S-box-containing protein
MRGVAKFDLSRWFAGIGSGGSSQERGESVDPAAAAERIRQAVDTLPVTLFEFDANGIYTACAGRYLKMFGVTWDQLIGRSVFDFPKFVPGKNMMVRRALAGESVAFTGIWPLGRFMIRLDPRFDAERRVVAVAGIGLPLSKPASTDKELEGLLEALRQSEARFRAMCDCAPLGIYVSNSKFELGYVNPALCSLLGRTPDELLGARWESVLLPEDRARLHTAYAARRGEVAYDGVLRLIHKDGTQVWTSLRVAEMRDDGELLGYVGALADITPERSARLAADRARHDLRRVIETSPEGIAVVRGGRWIFVNRALVEGLGYARPEQLIGQQADAIVHPEDRASALQSFAEPPAALEGAQGRSFELRYRRASGEYALMEIRPAALTEFEGAPALLLTARDVTERKKLEAQLLVTERLLSVGTLAAGVAHEINNPLGAALSNLDWVVARMAKLTRGQDGDGLSNGTLRSELQRLETPILEAREAAGRVRAIVRDLKMFSRTEEERIGAVELSKVLDSAARMAWNEARHRARLVRDYGELPPVLGSEARLGQVFLNLIINAAQAIPEGHADENEIRVSARVLASKEVVVSVRDTGCGIPAHVIGRIFDPFFTTKPPAVGTGLGLSICHRIVSGMDGRIEVESQPGHGSEFRVTLRAADPSVLAAAEAADPQRPSGPPSAPPPPPARGRVLVIDDDRAMANAIGLVLADDHDVEVCTSARHALASMHEGRQFDAIVCDVMMPEMSGIDFHSELSNQRPELASEIIFLTGGAFTLCAREFLDRISNPRLDKPFDSERLRGLVNRQVARVVR